MLTLVKLAGLLSRALGSLDGDNPVFIRHPDSDEDVPISEIAIEDGMVILIPELDAFVPGQ